MITTDPTTALRRAVLVDPSDDVPRLVLADALEMTAATVPWARLIRAQVHANATSPHRHVDPRAGELMITRYHKAWLGWNYLGGVGKSLGLEPRDVRDGLRLAAPRDDFKLSWVGGVDVDRGLPRAVSINFGHGSTGTAEWAVVKEWFGRHPLVVVKTLNPRPLELAGVGFRWTVAWTGSAATQANELCSLPHDVSQELPPGDPGVGNELDRAVRWYTTYDRAGLAFSEAVVRWGRRAHGLPVLPSRHFTYPPEPPP